MSIYEKGSDGVEVARVKLIDSGVGSASTVGITNSVDARIDPATEQKQDDTITALGTPRQEDGHGSATSDPSFVRLVGSTLVPEEYDEVDLSYTGDDLTTVVYKLATATVATLTLTWTSGKLTNVLRS